MKRLRLLTLIISIILSIVTPASLIQAQEPSPLIEDPVLEQAIRKELGILSDRELTVGNMEALISLHPQEGTEKIKSLNGLENAVHLEELVLPGHAVLDLTPLSLLWNLKTLDISSNEIEDVCPLKGLYSLEKLILSNNRIKSIDCLSGLWYLTDLLADGNGIEDVTVLVHLPLDRLNLENNRILDLSPLKGHPDLENLYLANNRIEDIRVLTTLPVLENVHLQGNPLRNGAQQAIEELKGLGVRVNPSPEEQLLNPMKVYVDGEKVRFPLPPVNEKGTTLVQFRPLFEKLGLTVDWEEETRKVTGQNEGTRIELQIGEKQARVNDINKYLEQAPRIINGSTFIPARFVAEALGHAVSYDHESTSVWIDTGERFFSYYGEETAGVSSMGDVLVKGWQDTPPTIEAYLEQYRSNLKNVTLEEEPKLFTVKGLRAGSLWFRTNMNGVEMINTTTILEGSDRFHVERLMSPADKHEFFLRGYNYFLVKLAELELRRVRQKEFSSMSVEERVKDAVAYYRGAGFFAENSEEGLTQLQGKVLSWLKEQYEWNEADGWFPFGKDSLYQDIADVFILEYDPGRVWIRDMEMDVLAGNGMYVQTLKEWAAISRGAFNPENIEEFWKTEEGPVTVRFHLNGEQETVYPFANSDWLDYSILDRINGMIKDTGLEFVVVHMDQSIFVTVLTQEEKMKLQEERLLEFKELDGY